MSWAGRKRDRQERRQEEREVRHAEQQDELEKAAREWKERVDRRLSELEDDVLDIQLEVMGHK